METKHLRCYKCSVDFGGGSTKNNIPSGLIVPLFIISTDSPWLSTDTPSIPYDADFNSNRLACCLNVIALLSSLHTYRSCCILCLCTPLVLFLAGAPRFHVLYVGCFNLVRYFPLPELSLPDLQITEFSLPNFGLI